MRHYLIARIRSFKYAFKGIALSVKQPNMQIHVFASIIVIITGLIMKLNKTEWCLIFIVIGLVLISEIINSAIEILVDRFSPGHNKYAGQIKDLAAGAVLITAIISIVAGLIIFLPKFIELFKII